MSREILFRGKRLDNGGWETGSLIIIRYGCSDARHYITDKMTGYPIPIDPATVGQDTGLCDKNGKKIFEGDVVHCEAHLDQADMVVIFEVGQFRLVLCEKFKSYTTGFGYYDINCFNKTVIGNIHDNPELAKEEAVWVSNKEQCLL